MALSRRGLLGAASLSLAAGGGAARAQTSTGDAGPTRVWSAAGPDPYGSGLDRLATYVDEHRQAYSLPGLTLCVVDAKGYVGFITSGWSNRERRQPLNVNEIFQVGSISKSVTALCIFRAMERGRLTLRDDVRDHVPGLHIETSERVSLQSLLNHSSGLADGPFLVPRVQSGALWLGYKPGSHWSYSNTGFGLLTLVLETLHGHSIEEIVQKEIFGPLGMAGVKSAIRQEDRDLYPNSYSPAAPALAYGRGDALATAPWVDLTSGAGNIAMAAPEMTIYLQWLIKAGRGLGAPLLSDTAAKVWTTATVGAPGWAPGASYANGLAVVPSEGRTLLHHTGGMIGFSSSVHIDPLAGIACFASVNMGSTGYRPREITRYACGLFRTLAEGSKPPTPHPTAWKIDKAESYLGRFYDARGESLEIQSSLSGLQVVYAGQTGPLEPGGDDNFVAHHPGLRRYALLLERQDGRAGVVWYGAQEFAADRSKLRGPAPADLAVLEGRYDDGAGGTTRIIARPTGLFLDGTTPLMRLADGSWRPGPEDWSPERVAFDAEVVGRPQRMTFSGQDLGRIADRT